MTRTTLSRIVHTGILLFLIAYGAVTPAPVSASGTILVNTTQDVYDGGACSLRNAIHAVNTHKAFGGCTAGDVIQLPAGDFNLTILNPNNAETDEHAGDLDITSDMTLLGAGPSSTRIQASGKAFGDRIFHITSGQVMFQGMRISGGFVSNSYGGGVLNDSGNLTLKSVTLDGNEVDITQGGAGGGVANRANGSLNIDYSTISTNKAYAGGGIYNEGQLSVNHSAIYKNNAGGSGGGLDTRKIEGGTANASILNTTIAFNSAALSGGGISSASILSIQYSTLADNNGGGLSIFSDSPTIQSTIFARNHTLNCYQALQDIKVNSSGYNLIDQVDLGNPNECSFKGTGDMVNKDPMLSAFGGYAGPTLTYGFQKGSPAIDALPEGDLSCPLNDQRGFARPVDGDGDGVARCDIGAYEDIQLYYIHLPVTLR